ncbi:cytochrome P450 [Tricholoma matsutake]|nr:cytochrome P450 [Tricholoma matsutake 945]
MPAAHLYLIPTTFQIIVLLAITVATVYTFARLIFSWKRVDKEGNPIPNGPVGLPIIDTSHYPELTLHHWAKELGPLYSMWFGNQLFVVEMFIKSHTVFARRGITATPYNSEWRKHPRIATGFLDARILHEFTYDFDGEQQYREGGMKPINPQPHACRCLLNNMLTIGFGTRTDTIDHPLMGRALRLSLSNLTDFVPLLQYLPNSMKTRTKKLHKDVEWRYDKDIMQWLSLLSPRAHVELGCVVGCNHLPDINDQQNLPYLPYLQSIVKEVERCHNPFWLGTPHLSTEDFTYQGQFIPKDTVVILNTSAHLKNAMDRDHRMFGAGHPGREVWLVIARMLWAFKMEQVPGELIDVKEYDGLSLCCLMIPRDHNVADVFSSSE